VVAIVAFVVSGIFLLFLVPDRSAPRVGTATEGVAVLPPRIEADRHRRCRSPASKAQSSVLAPRSGARDHGPLGGAGGPRRRLARHLPVEREGMTQFVAVDDIVAVHANAHQLYFRRHLEDVRPSPSATWNRALTAVASSASIAATSSTSTSSPD
jgi:hypothetical protein